MNKELKAEIAKILDNNNISIEELNRKIQLTKC